MSYLGKNDPMPSWAFYFFPFVLSDFVLLREPVSFILKRSVNSGFKNFRDHSIIILEDKL